MISSGQLHIEFYILVHSTLLGFFDSHNVFSFIPFNLFNFLKQIIQGSDKLISLQLANAERKEKSNPYGSGSKSQNQCEWIF